MKRERKLPDRPGYFWAWDRKHRGPWEVVKVVDLSGGKLEAYRFGCECSEPLNYPGGFDWSGFDWAGPLEDPDGGVPTD